MTEIRTTSDDAASVAVTDFGNDVDPAGIVDAFKAYVGRVRGGDTGALPAVGGLIVLFAVFKVTKSTFLTDLNFANLLQQATWLAILAMAVTFVLLIGEIDLAAGATMGVSAAIVYLRVKDGMPVKAELVVAVALGLAAMLFAAKQLRGRGLDTAPAWGGAAAIAVVLGLVLMTIVPSVAMAVLLGCVIATCMGLFTGFLVAKVGIPSFVVTLALFLAWQGLLLKIAKEGGSIRIDDKFLRSLANSPMRPGFGWVLWVLVTIGALVVALATQASRRAKGVSSLSLPVVLSKVGLFAAGWGYVTFRLNHNRALPNATRPLAGVPYVVPLVLILVVALSFLLQRTSYGRHLYAVGGNAEAARRAGIDVPRLRVSAFAVVGLLASIAGLVYGSRVGSVTPQTGAGDELLRAVGAAVVGGVSLFGGRGKVAYAVIGALVMATIDNGLGLFKQVFGTEVDAGLRLLVAGGVLLLAGGVDALTRRSAAA